MSNGVDALFGPLSKTYCNYFFIISAVALMSLILYVISAMILVFKTKNPGHFIWSAIVQSVVIGLMYLQSRLLYNMCSNSL